MSAIAAENVSKHWTTADGQVRAVDGISFALDAGTLNVLLGPSGCGKSTTLRLIAGLEQADGGRIRIDGRDVTDLPPAQRNIAMVFQSYALFPHLSVAENIVFGLQVRKVARGRDRARASQRVADLLGLSHAARPQAGAALRRPAAARRARPRDHRRGAGLPDGRAAVEPRRAAARRRCAREIRALQRDARHHDGLRDARPGRGDVDGRPRDPAQRRPHRAERDAGRALRDAGQHLRRALHRHAADEPAAARARARRRGHRRHRRPGGAAGRLRRAARWACGPSTSRSRFERGVRGDGRRASNTWVPIRSSPAGSAARRSRCASRGSVGLAARRRGVARRGRRARSTFSSATARVAPDRSSVSEAATLFA